LVNYLTGPVFWEKEDLPQYWRDPAESKVWRLTRVPPTSREYDTITERFPLPQGYKIEKVSACWTSILLVIKAGRYWHQRAEDMLGDPPKGVTRSL